MARGRVKEYLSGYVRVEVKGKNPERLINLCLSAGFPMWDFTPGETSVFFNTTLHRYRDIHRLARRSRCVPHIVRRVGLPFIVGKIRRRPIALLATVLVFFVLLYLSGGIWSLEVSGALQVGEEKILASAASAGLAQGARRSRISTEAVEDAIIEQNPELAWVYVRLQGTLAVIEVAEKTRMTAEGPGDVIAGKDGVVQSMLVLSGAPVARIGQTVKAGDLLIAGNPSGAIQGARGSVTAMVWYQVYKEVPLAVSIAERTGRKIELTVLQHGGNEFVLWGKSNLFEWYEVEDYPLTKAIISRVFYEVEWKQKEQSAEDAFAAAKAEMQSSIERQLPSLAKLVDLSCRLEASTEDMIAVRATACVVEEIGVTRVWKAGPSEVDR